MRQVALDDDYNHIGVSTAMVDNRAFYSSKGIVYFAPLYIYPPEQGLEASDKREPNLSHEFIVDISQRLGLRFIPDGKGDLDETFGPVDALHYIYAVFHSSDYRERYDQFLRADFPRVPLTGDADVYRVLVRLGEQLTNTHLPALAAFIDYQLPRPKRKRQHSGKTPTLDTMPPVQRPTRKLRLFSAAGFISARAIAVRASRDNTLDGVTSELWESRIGGYKPMEKMAERPQRARAQFRRHRALQGHRRLSGSDLSPDNRDRRRNHSRRHVLRDVRLAGSVSHII